MHEKLRVDMRFDVVKRSKGGPDLALQLFYTYTSLLVTYNCMLTSHLRLHGFVYFADNASARKAVAMAEAPFSYGKGFNY